MSFQIYISKTITPAIMDASATMQRMKGCREVDMETEDVVFETGGISPKPPVVAPPKSGLLAFKIVGGVPKPVGAAPVEDAVVGVGEGFMMTGDAVVGGVGVVVGVGFVVTGEAVVGGIGVGVGVGLVVTGEAVVGGAEAAEVANMQDAELGFVVVMTAAPPKSQLVGTGFR